jgi:pimeloyl-ACP methyl ester carboxylesterase
MLTLTAGIAGIPGCGPPPRVNPSFSVTTSDARAALRAMRDDPRPLARPLVILGGFSDPGWVAYKVRSTVLKLFDRGDRGRIIAVNFTGTGSFEQCRRRVIRAVNERFPSDDPARTVEVDVIGISMGGLVARVAADEATPGERRLRVARLFTIASPLRGARLASWHRVALTSMHRDMRAGSPLLQRLNARPPDYPVVSYSRLNDGIVGAAYASPAGQGVWWLDNAPLEHSHWAALHDPRILADIARRLRSETPFTTDPPAPLPASTRK